VVGLRGITARASAAAAAENKAIQAQIDLMAAAAREGPKTKSANNLSHQRTILEPGRLYRIDIDMVWSGEMFSQDKTGTLVPAGTKADQTVFAPKAGGNPSTSRKLFFMTAPKPVAYTPKKPGQWDYASWLYRRQDVFEPKMIERYLAGYDPGQSEAFRFCDDPLRAHFLQDHVAALAKAYGFDLSVAVRCTERPGDEHAKPRLLAPIWSFATDPAFLSPTDQRRYRYAITSLCEVPKPGATASVKHPLLPEAWYEIYVLAAPENESAFEPGRLPGVTFRTSRWRTPEDMFAGLGFTIAGEPAPAKVMMGDVAINPPAAIGAAVIEGDEQAYQNALLALGRDGWMDGWPVAEAPRLSRMWVPDGADGWLFAGLMVESPEPIHRPGRVDLVGLTLEMGNAGATIRFDIRRRDRSGSRLIYLTANPFRVITRELDGSPRLVLKAKSTLDTVSTDISGTLTIPLAPDFSEDP
jgi:hypothetical protein